MPYTDFPFQHVGIEIYSKKWYQIWWTNLQALPKAKSNNHFFHQKLVELKYAVHIDKKYSRHKKGHQYVSTMIHTSKIVHPFITNTDGPEDLRLWCNQILPTKQGQEG